jgi:DNA-directed RNA polymerase subunit M/transcription elongation factor TFIIS
MFHREVISTAMGDVCPRCGSLENRLSFKAAGTGGVTHSTWFATCTKCWHKWSPDR